MSAFWNGIIRNDRIEHMIVTCNHSCKWCDVEGVVGQNEAMERLQYYGRDAKGFQRIRKHFLYATE